MEDIIEKILLDDPSILYPENEKVINTLIAEGNAAGNAKVQAAVDALVDQTKAIESAVTTLKLSSIAFEGSDSLDNPKAVFE